MTDEPNKQESGLDRSVEKIGLKTANQTAEGGVIAGQQNQEVHSKAFAVTHAQDVRPSDPSLIATIDGESLEQYAARVEAIKNNPLVIVDSSATGKGSDESTGIVIDYKPQEIEKNKSFALGMDYEEQRESRSVYQKLSDFAQAAGERVADPDRWKAYIQGELDKMIGVGEGLNIAKETTKGAVVAGWNALTDGTIASFLAKPNAINDPLFHAVGGVITAVEEDPNAVNHSLERVGTIIMNGSERYSALPNREKGHVIGETMFTLVNPEGSTEGATLAAKVSNDVAFNVDATVMSAIQKSLKAAENAARTSPEVAQEMKQMLQSYLREKGLTGPEIEYAGVPKGYFDNIATADKGDSYLAMSKTDDPAEGLPRRSDGTLDGEPVSEKILPSDRFITELQHSVERLSESERNFLRQHGIQVKAVRRITDVPEATDKLGGCYLQADKTIYIPEEIFRNGQWVKNNDLPFVLRHEYGHALNTKAHPFGDPLSDKREFIEAFNQDFRVMPSQIKETLQLSEKYKTINATRDEVFADLWAHSTGLASNNPYSQMMKEKFPNVLTFFMERK